MKKFLTALLALCITASMTGCSPEPKTPLEEKIMEEYVRSMDMDIKFTQVSNSIYKTEDCSNPISPTIFCADPTAVEYEGRLYVYGTNDHQQYETVGDDGKNTYESIKSFVIFSTDDMVNWTYHGKIDTEAVAPWIISSWAPSITSRVEEDGLTHFYLYFSNNGCGVGVITATSPTGPWSDPLGEPLVSQSTEGLENCPNPFDPGVCIDENGVGWLSFGGGKAPDGTNYMPGVSRIVQLGEDMTSFASDFAEIKAPYFFEASELNYINDTYVYTYNNSWDMRMEWDYDTKKPSQCSMSYMTTKTPLDTDSWEYKGDYFPNPGDCGLDYSNNHSHLHKYNDKYYMFHHTMLKQSKMETRGGFRSLSVAELPVDEENLVFTETKTSAKSNVTQIKYVDPYTENSAETSFTSAGIGYEYEGTIVKAVKTEEAGAWIYIKGVDFGDKKADVFSAIVKGKGKIQVHADKMGTDPVAVLEFDNDEYLGVYNKTTEKLEGVHDLYIMISDPDVYVDSWGFADMHIAYLLM